MGDVLCSACQIKSPHFHMVPKSTVPKTILQEMGLRRICRTCYPNLGIPNADELLTAALGTKRGRRMERKARARGNRVREFQKGSKTPMCSICRARRKAKDVTFVDDIPELACICRWCLKYLRTQGYQLRDWALAVFTVNQAGSGHHRFGEFEKNSSKRRLWMMRCFRHRIWPARGEPQMIKMLTDLGEENVHQCIFWPFIVDFYLPARKLVIEIDGPDHKKHVRKDENRTARLLADYPEWVLGVERQPASFYHDHAYPAVVESIKKSLDGFRPTVQQPKKEQTPGSPGAEEPTSDGRATKMNKTR